jgi:hypothetical protein
MDDSDRCKKNSVSTSSPITRLPPELLGYIFTIAASCHPLDWDEGFLTTPRVPAAPCDARLSVLLSHVCHEWRSLVLGIRQLWTFSPFLLEGTIDDMESVMLERGKDVPIQAEILVLENNGRQKGLIAAWAHKLVQPEPQFQHLALSLPSEYFHIIFQQRAYLNSLHLRGFLKPYDYNAETETEAKELHTLTLECIINILPPILYANVTRLKLSNLYPTGTVLKDLLEILDHTRRLVELVTYFPRAQSGDVLWRAPQRQSMPHTPELEYVTLLGDYGCSSSLFRYLDVGKKFKRLCISAAEPWLWNTDEFDMMKTFLTWLTTVVEYKPVVAAFGFDVLQQCLSLDFVSIQGVETRISIWSADPAQPNINCCDYLLGFTRSIVWDTVETVKMQIPDLALTDEIMEVFESCEAPVTSWVVSDTSFDDYLVGVHPDVFPHLYRTLQDLELIGVIIREDIPTHHEHHLSITTLIKYLSQRRTDGVSLRNLVMTDCDLDRNVERALDGIQGLVEDFQIKKTH